jgi:integrase
MASLSKDGSAGWRIQFTCPTTQKRRTVRTGKCAKKNAETARNMIEKLVESKELGTALDGQTVLWLNEINGKLRQRLAKADLAEVTQTKLLGDFLEDYIEQRRRRGDVVPGTLKVWGHTRGNLTEFFGEDADIQAITPAQVDEWAAWMREDQKLAENSVRKRSQFSKMFFNVAKRRKLVSENPFADLVSTVVPVRERQHFVPRETVTALLDECRGPEYRLLLIFARYMSVRVPSEIVPLEWPNVNWDNLTIVITSPKTKRHQGRDQRVCPIFPEVLPYLQEAWDAAPEGATHIFPSIRSSTKNLRT